MKNLMVFTFAFLFSFSVFSQVHCDVATETELHSTDEVIIGTGRFANSEACLFAAAAANEASSEIACAPYEDSRVKGFSIYRLEDGKDLGPSIFSNLNDCQFSVLFSSSYSFCAPSKGKYTLWDIDENEQYQSVEYSTLQSCIVNSKK
jgi:hypothetical protein